MKKSFKIGLVAALLLALTGSKAWAADPTVASVDMSDIIRKDGRPSTTAGGMVRDPLFNAEVFVRAAARRNSIPGLDATQSGLNQLRDDWVAGRPPAKTQIPVGTVTWNYYVILPSGSRVAQVRRRSNRPDGRYRIPAGERRFVTGIEGMTMSIGTCCNYLPLPVKKEESKPPSLPQPVPEKSAPPPPPEEVKVPPTEPTPAPEKPVEPVVVTSPVYEAEVEQPAPVLLPPPPAPKSGYFPGRPSREVDRYPVGGFGVIGRTSSGRSIVRGRRQTIGGGDRGGTLPPGGGGKKDRDGNGDNSGGGGDRGID